MATIKTILVPVDFSPITDRVIETAIHLAKPLSAHVHLVHVAAPEPEFIGYEPGPQSVRDTVAQHLHDEHRKLQDIEKRLAGKGIEVTALLIQGFTVEKILAEAERIHADLLIAGTHGHSALRSLLVGSTADGLLRGARCPVVVIPPA